MKELPGLDLVFRIKAVKVRPKVKFSSGYFPPSPYDISKDRGVKVEDASYQFLTALVKYDDSKGGLAIIEARSKVGSFYYKCGDEKFKKVEIPKDSFLFLNKACLVKFVPTAPQKFWVFRSAYIEAHIADGSDDITIGIHSLKGIDMKNNKAYSLSTVTIYMVQWLCGEKNFIFSLTTRESFCKKKCDGVIGSSARLGENNCQELPLIFATFYLPNIFCIL